MAIKDLKEFRIRISLLNKAIWSNQVFVKVVNGYYYNGGKWALKVIECEPNDGIEAKTLNQLYANYSNGIFIKMDIEGTEKKVLAPNTEWINQSRCFYVEIHDQDGQTIFDDFIERHNLEYIGLFEEMHFIKNPKHAGVTL